MKENSQITVILVLKCIAMLSLVVYDANFMVCILESTELCIIKYTIAPRKQINQLLRRKYLLPLI